MSPICVSRWSRPLLALAILGTASLLSGAAAPAPTLTLPDLLQRVADANPSLRAQSYDERVAEAWIEQAGQRPNPALEITAENFAGTGRVQGVRGLEATVQASQALERGGKREKRVALASRERDVAAQALAVRRAEVLAGAATAFVETLAAQQRLALAAGPLRLAEETVATATAHVSAGAASPAEVARARAALASARAEVARAVAGLSAAQAALAAQWGGVAADVPPLAGALRVPETLPAESEFLARLADHPRLGLQQAAIAGRRAALDLEQAAAVTDLTVAGGVRFLREGSDATWVAGVSWPLPLRHRNQGAIRAARFALAGAEQTVIAVEAELRAAGHAAWQELAAAHAAAWSLRREALPATEEAHTVVRRAYEAGELPLLDVLETQRALAALHRELVEAESAYALALTRAEALTGTTFPLTARLLSSE